MNKKESNTISTASAQITNSKLIFIFLSILIIYLVTLTQNYYWDGLSFSLVIERFAQGQGNLSKLFHQNHLCYNVLGYLLYHLISKTSTTVPVLYLLQIISVLSSVIGLIFFFRIVNFLIKRSDLALIGTLLLAFANCWWKCATDADSYSISIMLILITIYYLIGPKQCWWISALSFAGALLIHQLSSLTYPALITAIIFSNQIAQRINFAIKFSLLAWSITISTYYYVAIVICGIKFLDVIRWTTTNPYGVKFSNPIKGLLLLPKYHLDMIVGFNFTTFFRFGGTLELISALILLIVLTIVLITLLQSRRLPKLIELQPAKDSPLAQVWQQILPMIGVWILVYEIFLIFWESYFISYRLYYLPAMILLLTLILANYFSNYSNASIKILIYLVTVLFCANLAFTIGPYMRIKASPIVASANQAQKIWNSKTVVLYTSSYDTDYIFQYFNRDVSWEGISVKRIKSIEQKIDEIYQEGGNVWLNRNAIKAFDERWIAARRGAEIRVDTVDALPTYLQLLPLAQERSINQKE